MDLLEEFGDQRQQPGRIGVLAGAGMEFGEHDRRDR